MCESWWYMIYIPLCLYLYAVNIAVPQTIARFTFHYVYIYILFSIWCKELLIKIYMPLCLYLYRFRWFLDFLNFNLHSTMFIFIYVEKLFNRCKLIPFTFHYVYIYMDYSKYLLHLKNTFTFHYVYIYMRKKDDLKKKGKIYIPLCLYLYYPFIYQSCYHFFIYIPLCLYLYQHLPGN